MSGMETRVRAIAAELAALDATEAGGLPNAPGNVDHVGYKDGLYRELESIGRIVGKAVVNQWLEIDAGVSSFSFDIVADT